MHYWMIAFLFTPDGQFLTKVEQETPSYQACVTAAGEYAMSMVNRPVSFQLVCVSNDHYQGVTVDETIELDYDLEIVVEE